MTTTAKRPQTRMASVVSDAAGPLPVMIALVLAGVHDHRPIGSAILWGLLAMVLLAVLPYVVTRSARHPADGARPSAGRKGVYVVGVAATALVGFVVLWLLPSPRALIDVAVAVIVALVAIAILTAVAGWSNHAAACAGGVALCIVLGGWTGITLLPLVVVVGWARIELGRHELPQVIGGAVTGALVAGGVLVLLL